LPLCPVIVLTGGAGPEARRAVLRAGAQDYIGKDWLTPRGLTWAVENAIERLAMARQLLRRDEALRRNELVLASADRRKDEFIAMLAHELRNPLAPVRTGAKVLRLTDDVDIKHKTLDIIDRQLGQMTRLIDDLLDASRIATGKVSLLLERISIFMVAESVVEAVRPLMDARRHRLLVDLPAQNLWLDADPARVIQVVSNLLSNAAKYSPDGSRITLSFRRDETHVVIEVRDTGSGIPADKLEEVFEMFAQVDQTLDRAHGGLGIGLALVKRLVELHHGSVSATSGGPGRGCTFTVRLPCALDIGAVDSGDELLVLSASMTARRILVVDDNEDAAMTLAMVLDMSGHQTRVAFNGSDALLKAASFLPEVVFLDIGLPGMTGYEVAAVFRADDRLKDAVLVAVTGWGSKEDRLRSQTAGFDRHLTKPVDTEAFDQMLLGLEDIRAQRTSLVL
jgi:signal transduction histidine kinase/ActR/RegA family two-component response regulator